MPWRKKVKQMKYTGENRETASYTAGEVNDKDKANQEHYEKKVKDLLKCCKQFEKSLKNIKSINEFTAEGIEVRFKINFRVFLKKTISKTKRVLNDMDKKLRKLGRKPLVIEGKDEKNNTIKKIDDDLIAKIKNAFEYDAPKDGWDKDTIDYAAIYDRVVYEFFNNKDNKPLRLFNAIDDLAGRALQRIEKESQKNVAVWVGKKLNVIKAKIKEMKGTLQAAETQLGNAGEGLQAATDNLEGNSNGPNNGNSKPAFLRDIRKRNKSTSGTSAVGQGSGAAADKKYDEEIEKLKKQIEEMKAHVKDNLLALSETEEGYLAIKSVYLEAKRKRSGQSDDLSESGGVKKALPNMSFKSKTLAGMVVKDNSMLSGVKISLKYQMVAELGAFHAGKEYKAKDENELKDLQFEIEKQGDVYYSVQEYIDNCKTEVKKFEDAFDSIAGLIDDFSKEDEVKTSVEGLIEAMGADQSNVDQVLKQAKELKDKVNILEGETQAACDERNKLKGEVYNKLKGEVDNLKKDLKKINEYKNKTLAANREETVKAIKEYKFIYRSADNAIKAKETALAEYSRKAFTVQNIGALKTIVSGIRAKMDAIGEDELDDFLESENKDDLLRSINSKIEELMNDSSDAVDRITRFKDSVDLSKKIAEAEKDILKGAADSINTQLGYINKIKKSDVKLVKGETAEKLKEKKKLLSDIQAKILEMEKILYKDVAKKSEKEVKNYTDYVTGERDKLRAMRGGLSKFKKAGNAIIKISNQAYNKDSFMKVVNSYKEALNDLKNVPGFENVGSVAVPPPPPGSAPNSPAK